MAKFVITHPASKPPVLSFLVGAFVAGSQVELVADEKATETTLQGQYVANIIIIVRLPNSLR